MAEPTTTTFGELIDSGILEIGDGYRAKGAELGGDGFIFLRAGCVTESGFEIAGADRFHAELGDRVAGKLSQESDVLVTTKGNSTGRTAYVGEKLPTVVYSPHLSYWRVADRSQLCPGFLRYWARGAQFRRQLNGMKASTDMAPYLSLQDQRILKITVPPITYQEAIAEVLGALDDKIELNREMNRTLEEMASALFRSWFIDFDPVVAKADGRAPAEMDAATAALFPDAFIESDEMEIPQGWSICSFSDVGEWLSGGTPRVSTAEYWNGDIPWISAKTLTERCVIESDRNVTALGAENGTRVVPPGTLLFIVRGMSLAQEFRFGLSDRPVAFNQDLKAVVPRRVPSSFLLAWLAHSTSQILGLVDAASHGTRRLQTELIGSLPLVLPPPTVLVTLCAHLDEMLRLRFAHRRQIATLTALRDTLLPQLISGTIRLKDAERAVGEA